MPQINAKNEVTLEIDALSYGAYGIGRVDHRVWMVPHSAPGDTITARVIEERERFSIGELVRVISSSPARRTPPCPYVGTCGGCAWQHLNYRAQLEAKQRSVDDALRRIGKLRDFELRPILPAVDEFHYRRRIRLQVGPANELGFYAASSHDLVEIESCLIADDRLNGAIEALRRWARGLNTAIEHVEIVTGDEPNQTVVVVRASDNFIPRDELACANLISMESGIHGLIIAGRASREGWGEPRITVGLREDLTLKVDADVFTQVNSAGNRRILDELLRAGDFQPNDRILELFCGAGNFTLPMARQVQAVTAVEGHRPSVANAKLNAQRNAIDNIRWICAPVPKALAELKRRGQQYTKIVLDPPRAGAKGIEANLAALGAARVFYVSCNPATLARDLAALTRHGYKLRVVQPMDLFPQTFHVETLAVIEKS
ncbi:MAG TPA: 23S rRNA (uracil(1939)-C(5))-methyltransferase RlmD [Candidatus Binatia bacterium]